MAKAHNLGFPRIGINREMKQAVEAFWKGNLNEKELIEAGKAIRKANWEMQKDLDLIPVGDFSWYDHVLDMSVMLGVIPPRFETQQKLVDTNTYFHMARGRTAGKEDVHASEMIKWFDTNYHYLVPELSKNQKFELRSEKLFDEVLEAKSQGYNIKPVLLGPLSYLWLSKEKEEGFDKLELLNHLLPIYKQILKRLKGQGIEWVQLDEPILVLDLPDVWKKAFNTSYQQLHTEGLKILLATYFGDLEDNLELTFNLLVDGIHVDAVRAPKQIAKALNQLDGHKVLSIGIVDGRNVWKTDLKKALEYLEPIHKKLGDRLWVAGSSSLLHSPMDLDLEHALPNEFKNWLAFAKQKVIEIKTLVTGLNDGQEAIQKELTESNALVESRKQSKRIHNPNVKKRIQAISEKMTKRGASYSERYKTQRSNLKLPVFPTTTIGSFPQTKKIRSLRHDMRMALISEKQYIEAIQEQISNIIKEQEDLGIDVLVHGEAERNDMVEYFGELMEGFAFTENGWVQSYGTRCVKPPIIYGDIERLRPMTVQWISYAQSLTNKPVKGMLTGPMTMICWSFVRDDQPKFETAKQIALALRDEVNDLEKAGIHVIQIDEPAFREGLPLRHNDWDDYLAKAVEVFRIASSGVQNETQIHTHMCYSEFNDIIEAIADMDADVITIETSRSDMKLLKAFKKFEYPNEIGPGVYDIHSPRIPKVEEIVSLIEKAADYIPVHRLWINPDCGLKTRDWPETKASLENMVAAARILRDKFDNR